MVLKYWTEMTGAIDLLVLNYRVKLQKVKVNPHQYGIHESTIHLGTIT